MNKDMKEAEDNELFGFRWRNFRIFEDTGWITIKPLTIFIGPNNSGKTSLIDPILVCKQTLESMDFELPLKLKGKYVNVGDYESLINGHEIKKNLKFYIRFQNPKDKEAKEDIGENPPCLITLSFKKAPKERDILKLKYYELCDIYDRLLLKRKLTSDGDYSLELFKEFENDEEQWKSIIEISKPLHFLFDVIDIFKGKIDKLKSEKRTDSTKKGFSIELKPGSATSSYLQIVSYFNLKIRGLFGKIDYIGPLREHPKRFYESIGERPYSVGDMGQFTPHILLRMRDERDLSSLNEWLKKFELRGEIGVEEHKPGLLFSIVIGDREGTVTNIADLGFGISQVLPLITQGMWMDEKRTIIAEQPEIHLNPKLQCTLADFFVHLVNSNKSVILETHSEHLIMRLRTLIADPHNKIKNSDVALYFIEKVNGKTSIRLIPIDSKGYIADDDWPKNFFDEAFTESLNLADMQ